jgi:hypothetical protein
MLILAKEETNFQAMRFIFNTKRKSMPCLYILFYITNWLSYNALFHRVAKIWHSLVYDRSPLITHDTRKKQCPLDDK